MCVKNILVECKLECKVPATLISRIILIFQIQSNLKAFCLSIVEEVHTRIVFL